jgi:hypothetical protein
LANSSIHTSERFSVRRRVIKILHHKPCHVLMVLITTIKFKRNKLVKRQPGELPPHFRMGGKT